MYVNLSRGILCLKVWNRVHGICLFTFLLLFFRGCFSFFFFFFLHKVVSNTKNFKQISLTCNLTGAITGEIVESEFELQSCYYVHLRINTFRKDMKPFILLAMG